MRRRPDLHPGAKIELREAADYYDEQRTGLGSEFLDAVEAAMLRIIKHPESAPVSLPPVRTHQVERFPFSVIYSIRDGDIFVSAIAHNSRRPFYWKDRL